MTDKQEDYILPSAIETFDELEPNELWRVLYWDKLFNQEGVQILKNKRLRMTRFFNNSTECKQFMEQLYDSGGQIISVKKYKATL